MTSLTERQKIIEHVEQARASGACLSAIAEHTELCPRSYQRWCHDTENAVGDKRSHNTASPRNKLSEAERLEIVEIANSEAYGHLSPCQIAPKLADEGRYLASEATIYRVLHEHNQMAHRQATKPGQRRVKPAQQIATGPNQVYSWDITYLAAGVLGQFYYLYMVMDVFSRKIVGHVVHACESSTHAAALMDQIYRDEDLAQGQVVLHSDNGAPMKGATLTARMSQLGVALSYSRPSVSNDNPYSESLFGTMKYRPSYPEARCFEDIEQASVWVDKFVQWYNHEHFHSGIKFVTPAQRHAGKDKAMLEKRAKVYELAKAAHPERWSRNTRNWDHINVVSLNPDNKLKLVA